MAVTVLRGNARRLPLADACVDLVVTSPPYLGLRSYRDGGEHYPGQIGGEATPAEFVDALVEVTRECMRVLKPSGSIFVNLGDAYAGSSKGSSSPISDKSKLRGNGHVGGGTKVKATGRGERVKRHTTERMTRTDAAWLAGVIDSDGSVSVHINKQPEGNAPSFVAWVRIGQMRPEVVQRAAEITGIGQVYKDARGVWNWSASAQQARWVLERIWPWLLIKQRPAHAAIEVARHVEERNAKGSWRPLTTGDIAYRQRLRDAALTWNSGGQDDLEPPTPRTVSLPDYPGQPRAKSLTGIPWRYALRCIDELGLILRRDAIWHKAAPMPETVTDRHTSSHEYVFHLVKEPRYYAAIDRIRRPYAEGTAATSAAGKGDCSAADAARINVGYDTGGKWKINEAGALPGSVWRPAPEPLNLPARLGKHHAPYPTTLIAPLVRGFSPEQVCTVCGEGLAPVSTQRRVPDRPGRAQGRDGDASVPGHGVDGRAGSRYRSSAHITGEACACDVPGHTRPGVVLDIFGGTGTTAHVADALGRHGITLDMSADYCRIAGDDWMRRRRHAKVHGLTRPVDTTETPGLF